MTRLSADAVIEYQSWVCREEHFDQERHDNELEEHTKAWKDNSSDRKYDDFGLLPSYLANDDAKAGSVLLSRMPPQRPGANVTLNI